MLNDATRFIVPDRLKEFFKGTVSKSGVNIQYEYDIKNRRTIDLTITDVKRCDLVDAKETISKVLSVNLIIRNLCYFILSLFSEIKRTKAFFLSRLNVKCYVFKEYEETTISFKELYSQMTQIKKSIVEFSVTVGNQERLPVRLIVQLVLSKFIKNELEK